MGDPHNPKRYGETWDSHRITILGQELAEVRDLGIVSGGWAWHIMSPPHEELKHRHDHKDIDLFVAPEQVVTLIGRLTSRGYRKEATRFDRPGFRRFVNEVDGEKVIFDIFIEPAGKVPHVEVDEYRVVEPTYLLGLYRSIHSSGGCFAVKAAHQFIERKQSVVKNPLLATFRLP